MQQFCVGEDTRNIHIFSGADVNRLIHLKTYIQKYFNNPKVIRDTLNTRVKVSYKLIM